MAITRFQVSWEGAFSAVVREIKKWEPRVSGSEAHYRDDLADYLRQIAKDARVEREYPHLGGKIDIYFVAPGMFSKDQVLIETKLNLTNENEYKRLIGQIETMRPSRHFIVLVLLGNTKPEFAARLKERYGSSLQFAMIEKPLQKRAPKVGNPTGGQLAR